MSTDAASAPTVLLSARDLSVDFALKRGLVAQAVTDVSFDLWSGETLGLVGESGCGKSTLSRALVRLVTPTSGEVEYSGQDLGSLSASRLRSVRREIQLIFQDPISSLNPRRSLIEIVAEPLAIAGVPKKVREKRAVELLDAVGLDGDSMGSRKPHEFSGGQCQRISIARALSLDPTVLICDEPVSALDVSVQAQVINLLEHLKRELDLTMIFVSHDLSVIKNVSDRVAVMYLGRIVEIGATEEVFHSPRHHYTKGLFDAIPRGDRNGEERSLPIGEPPSPVNPPSGCRFRTRCPMATDICASEVPPLTMVTPSHEVACHHPLEYGDAAPSQIVGAKCDPTITPEGGSHEGSREHPQD